MLQLTIAARSWHVLVRIGIATVAVMATVALQSLPGVELPGKPFLLNFIIVLASAAVFGRTPGFVAAAVTSIASLPYFEPVYSYKLANAVAPAAASAAIAALSVEAFCRLVDTAHKAHSAGAQRRETQARLAAIVTSSKDAIVSRTLDGIVTSWNEAAERMFGYTAAEMVGQSIQRLIPADRQPEEDVILASLARDERVENYETVCIAKDRRTINVSVAVSPIRDAEGRVTGASNIVRDITERKRTEAQLVEHEAQLSLFVEQAPAAIAMFDDKMRYLAVSRRFLSDYELGDPAEVIGRSQYEIFPDMPWRWRDIHVRVLAGEELSQTEDFYPRQDGRAHWVRWSMKPWRTADGRIGGALLFAEVITEQLEARRALADSEARFRATFENAAVGIAHVAPDGRWLRVNQSLCRILGYRVRELIKKSFQDVTHPDDLPDELAEIERMHEGTIDSYGMDKRYLRKDGAIVWARKTVGCVRKGDGSIDYFVSVIEDISARKHAEQLLRRQTDLLDQSHDAILAWKIGGGIAYWSRGAEALYGYTAEEALGQNSHKLLQTRSPISIHEVEAQIAREGSWYGELTHTTREGRVIVVESRHVRVSYDGEIYALETNRDVTERKRAESRLAEREAQLALFVEHAPVAIAMFDSEMRYMAVSRRFLSDYKLPAAGEIIGRSHYEIVPDTPQRWRQLYTRVLAGEELGHEEDPFPRQDGRVERVQWSMKPWRTADGRIGGALLFSQFVTGILAEREARFQATFDNAAVGIAHVAPDGRWLRVNQALCRILGYPVDELLTMTFQDVTYPDDLPAELAQVERMREGKLDNYDMDKRYLRKDGAIVWGRLTRSAVRKSDKSIDYFVAVIEDISARKRAEEQVHLLMREANHRIKNLLGLVQVIARQTAAGSPEDFVGRFTERVQALAANQDLLGRDQQQGADLEDLIRTQLAHFADLVGSRITLRGPKLRLNAAAAQAIGLALHELATNAGKYGALSVGAGRTDVGWRLSDDIFTMDWTERDGPPVSPPDRRGFGSTVIASMAKLSVGGEVQLDYARTGLTWRLTCPAMNALEPGNVGKIKGQFN